MTQDTDLSTQASADRGGLSSKTALTLAILGLGLCLALDTTVAGIGLQGRGQAPGKQGDLHSLFRVMGYIPTWALLGAALMLTRPVPRRLEINNFLWSFAPLFSAALSGVLAAVLKVVFRRVRADQAEGAFYVFRPLTDEPLSGSGLSMPSEHAAVAFGAAWMLVRMYPGGWPVFVLLGAGCAGSRLIGADHYLSDVYVSAVVGYLVAWALVKVFGRRDQPATSSLPQAGGDTAA